MQFGQVLHKDHLKCMNIYACQFTLSKNVGPKNKYRYSLGGGGLQKSPSIILVPVTNPGNQLKNQVTRAVAISNRLWATVNTIGGSRSAAGARPPSTQILSFLHTNFPQSCCVRPWHPLRSQRPPSGNPGSATEYVL